MYKRTKREEGSRRGRKKKGEDIQGMFVYKDTILSWLWTGDEVFTE